MKTKQQMNSILAQRLELTEKKVLVAGVVYTELKNWGDKTM